MIDIPKAMQLSLAQQFELKRLYDAIDATDPKAIKEVTKNLIRLMFVKENIIRQYMKEEINEQFNQAMESLHNQRHDE